MSEGTRALLLALGSITMEATVVTIGAGILVCSKRKREERRYVLKQVYIKVLLSINIRNG